MAKYIERDAAIEAIMSVPPDAHYPQWYADMIKIIPTIDAVPVVRCKDCVFYDHLDCYMNELTRPDDFCSHGVRKDEAE